MRFVIRGYQPTNHGSRRRYYVCDRLYGFKIITRHADHLAAVRAVGRLERNHREHLRQQVAA